MTVDGAVDGDTEPAEPVAVAEAVLPPSAVALVDPACDVRLPPEGKIPLLATDEAGNDVTESVVTVSDANGPEATDPVAVEDAAGALEATFVPLGLDVGGKTPSDETIPDPDGTTDKPD